METLVICPLALWAVWLGLAGLRNEFKIKYYETKLENRGVDIARVKNMPFYKLWLD